MLRQCVGSFGPPLIITCSCVGSSFATHSRTQRSLRTPVPFRVRCWIAATREPRNEDVPLGNPASHYRIHKESQLDTGGKSKVDRRDEHSFLDAPASYIPLFVWIVILAGSCISCIIFIAYYFLGTSYFLFRVIVHSNG